MTTPPSAPHPHPQILATPQPPAAPPQEHPAPLPWWTEASVCATDLLAYGFCPRFTYFEQFLDIPEHQEKRALVLKGREVHEEKQQVNLRYLRKKIGCVDRKIAVKLYGQQGRLAGEIDEVLFLEDGSAAPLDYKWSVWKERVRDTYLLQLAFYARLIQENFDKPVSRGFLVYVRSQNHFVEVPLDANAFAFLDRSINTMLRIRTQGFFPPPAATTQPCLDCCYKNICTRV